RAGGGDIELNVEEKNGLGKPKCRTVNNRKRIEIESVMVKKFVKRKLIRAPRFLGFLDGRSFDLPVVDVGRIDCGLPLPLPTPLPPPRREPIDLYAGESVI
ncbi:hypothetical protein LINPERPRIM_LOCUS14607, partial [Linum perenne]